MNDAARIKDPYADVFRSRIRLLNRLRQESALLAGVKQYYRTHIADFISDWGTTYVPFNAAKGLPVSVPFILDQKQRQWVDWCYQNWRDGAYGGTEKSRDVGLSWLMVAFSIALCVLEKNITIGWGSFSELKVDRSGDMGSLFEKGRFFLDSLPDEFKAGYERDKHSIKMVLTLPESKGSIIGEIGDKIGRGGRTAIYFVDEAAHLEHDLVVDAALSKNTPCRQDISSVCGMTNSFAQRMHDGVSRKFTYHWRAQPLGARILTPAGWITMGAVRPGDAVIGADGKRKQVIRVAPQGLKETFQVRFSDGALTECCADHLWSVIPLFNQRATKRHVTKVMRLRDIAIDYKGTDKRGFNVHRYQVPVTKEVEFSSNQKLPVDPYVLGCLLGDGSFQKISSRPIVLTLGANDEEIAALVDERLPEGCSLKRYDDLHYRIAADVSHRGGKAGRGRHNPINAAVRSLGLSGTESHTKFIPDQYLLSRPQDRLEVLRGLMDTDGCVLGSCSGSNFTTVSDRLAGDVAFLVQALGGTATIYEAKAELRSFPGGRRHQCRKRYTVAVRLPEGITPFRMQRKARAFKPLGKYGVRRSIVGIEFVGKKQTQCIQVEDDLYLTDDCIVTHNSNPRFTEEDYAAFRKQWGPVITAQELDIDYLASVEGVIIPQAHVQAMIDAHKKLKIEPSGIRRGALDIADEGKDVNAFAARHGPLVTHCSSWRGKGSFLHETTDKACLLCDTLQLEGFDYDADGMGAGVRSDMNRIAERRVTERLKKLKVNAYRGSGEVFQPEQKVKGTDRTAKDMYQNLKAQSWGELARRAAETARAVLEGGPYDPDLIISLDSKIPELHQLCMELSQAQWKISTNGKLMVDKAPETVIQGMKMRAKSPNLADAVVILFSPKPRPMRISDAALDTENW